MVLRKPTPEVVLGGFFHAVALKFYLPPVFLSLIIVGDDYLPVDASEL